jgi:hypothetical protein
VTNLPLHFYNFIFTLMVTATTRIAVAMMIGGGGGDNAAFLQDDF